MDDPLRYCLKCLIAKIGLDKRVSIVDTMKTDKKGIPKDVKEPGYRKEKSI